MVCSEQELIIKRWLVKRAVFQTASRKNHLLAALLRLFDLFCCLFVNSLIDERVNEQECYASSTLLLSRLQTIGEKSVRCEKYARHDTCVWVISCCLCCFMRHISPVSNCLVLEVIIMHETKGFSRAIRDKI